MNTWPLLRRKRTWLLLAVLVLWAGYHYLQSQGALREQALADRRQAEELRGQLESADRTMETIKLLGQETAAARAKMDRWDQARPEGPSVVWFPVWLRARLQQAGIVEAQIRLNTEIAEPGFPGFKRTYWNVNVPPQAGLPSMKAVLEAVEKIEQRERLVKIADCSFRASAVDPYWPAGGFNVEALVPD